MAETSGGATTQAGGRVGHFRWVVCALLFFGTTVNYIDRQVLGILAPDLRRIIGWDDVQYGYIVTAFSAAYAIGLLLSGRLLDTIGTKLGYSAALVFWSLAAMAHALARTPFGFGTARFALGLGEAANFPAAIKAVAEWFPKKERAFATGIFNAGTNVGAIIAPLVVPWLALTYSWQWAFILTGAFGFTWLLFWFWLYETPEKNKRLSKQEFDYIRSDPAETPVPIPWLSLARYRQTWAFALGKFMTDPIWWFYLYWVPSFLNQQHGITLSKMGPPLVAIYLIADVGSIGGGWLSSWLIKRGYTINRARKTAMLAMALCVVPIVFASQVTSVWAAVALVGLAAAAHQGWSANMFTIASDMFPRRAVGSVVGFGGMAGAIGGMLIAIATGWILQLTGSYHVLFVLAGCSYLAALVVVHLLVPRLDPAPIDGVNPMKPLLNEDFLLETETARELYHGTAKDLPIIDYHCHLSPELMADDHRFRSITEIWLEGDHYKWRAMRTNGIPERFCSGDASDFDKFEAWARTVPETLGNPLYHWTAMELLRPFGIDEPLSAATARDAFARANDKLKQDGFTALGLLAQWKVAVVCSTDDPTDSLEPHRQLASRKAPVTQVYPTWRPDKAVLVEDLAAWTTWVEKLEAASGVSIATWDALLEALEKRHGFFHERGCRASDHGLERLDAEACTEAEAQALFTRLRAGRALEAGEARAFRSALLHRLALLDHARGWVQQFHVGAMRNNNTRMRRLLGPDTGFDSVGDLEQGRSLARFLDRLDESDQLARTILYNLNPADNELMATMIGNFQDGSVPGKLQWGSAWWFLDQLDGMEAQLRGLANMGLLSRFVGMITDSRSFLSYSRHEYFRRLLCNILGEDVRRGRLPDDRKALANLVANVCFYNARDYFRFPLGSAAGAHANAPRPA